MRLRTVAVLLIVVLALAGLAAGAVFLVSGSGGGTLTELWVSDTARGTDLNHHGVGASEGVVVAPVLESAAADDLTRESCALVRLAPGDGTVRWRYGITPEQCFIHSLTRPTVVDLDGDGRQEVVAGTATDETVVLAADGREQFAIPTSTYGYAEPTVADLDGDARPEVVVSDIGGGVVVTEHDGTELWRANVSGAVYDAPLVVDLDGDGSREVVVASRTTVVAFERDGTRLWSRSVSGNDVEAAATDEGVVLVAAGNDGAVALDGATGDREWQRPAAGTAALDAVGDGDGDGRLEAYVSAAGNRVRALEVADGSRDWESELAPTDGVDTPPPVLADLSGDGDPELVAATHGGTVVVLDPASGSELAAYERQVRVWTAPTAANLTASPGEEILVRYGDGRVVALAYGE